VSWLMGTAWFLCSCALLLVQWTPEKRAIDDLYKSSAELKIS
jgi:hypothetical protein